MSRTEHHRNYAKRRADASCNPNSGCEWCRRNRQHAEEHQAANAGEPVLDTPSPNEVPDDLDRDDSDWSMLTHSVFGRVRVITIEEQAKMDPIFPPEPDFTGYVWIASDGPVGRESNRADSAHAPFRHIPPCVRPTA